MTVLRGRYLLLAAASLLIFQGIGQAECSGPQDLRQQMRLRPTSEVAIQLGSWYASHNQLTCAIEVFRLGLTQDPNSARLHYLNGLALIEAKHSDEALLELRRSADLEPEILQPHLLLAALYHDSGNPSEAEREWKIALQIDPRSEQALEGLSALYIDQQDYPAAIELLKRAPQSGNERLTIALATAMGRMGFLAQTEGLLKGALAKNPQSVELAEALRVLLIKSRRYDEALDLEEKVVAQHPGDLNARRSLLEVLILMNRLDQAQPIGQMLLEKKPKDPQILYLNGVIQRKQGNDLEAKRLLGASIAIDPDFYNSRYQLGLISVSLHDWQAAKLHLEKAIALGAPQPEAHLELARALRAMGEKDRADQELKKYQELKKSGEVESAAAGAASQGDRDIADGKINEAVERYREATQTEPTNADYHFRLAKALDGIGDVNAEKEQLEEAIRLDPTLAGAQNSLGFLLNRSGDYEGAVEHFRKAVEVSPRWPEAWINLAAELAITARFREAKQAVTKALQLDPENAQAKELADQLEHDPRAQQ